MANPQARILVVDDDPDIVTILVRQLQSDGFAVLAARSGRECLQTVGATSIDVILLDLMMPQMDGFAVCRALKKDRRSAEIPVILVTARDDLNARSEAIRLGVSEFLSKPFSRRQLLERVRAQLDLLAASRTAEATLQKVQPRK